MPSESPSFAGRRVLVTGAGKGIGRSTAERLARLGAHVIALSRDPADLASLQATIGGSSVAVDLHDSDATAAAVSATLPVDLLVNCAGIAILDPFIDARLEDFDLTMAVNVRAPMQVAQIVVRDWLKRRVAGAIVNVSSIAAQVGTPKHAAYCASKAALDGLTRVMARELGTHGIRVNSVNPGITLTPMGERAWSDPARSGPALQRMPLGRFAEPEEVAAVICFLLSAQAAMVHGVCLDVDGGFRSG
ncbi:MAG: SDR family oxidoreductase [Pseudomonadota bacterium]|nr:SDR family oxidoreductase [Pseudomonadota bacterium]